MSRNKRDILFTGSIITAVVTFLVFITAGNNQFVALDDYGYIVNNRNIAVFNRETVVWSLTSFCEGNWHPLTMLSLAIDRSIWGLSPFGFHLTNILIHSLTVFLCCHLFAALLIEWNVFRCTVTSDVEVSAADDYCKSGSGERWVSFGGIAGALFFGLHPLRVESVVWASERKDVLCLLFLVLSLTAYVRYVSSCRHQVLLSGLRSVNYRYSVIFALLALMSKPTAVSLPFILCIIDWCPLGRFTGRESLRQIVVEKVPFCVLSTVSVILTLYAQQGAMNFAPKIDILSRLLVACRALLFYIATTVWPSGLSAFYMHPGEVAESATAEYLFYALLVFSVSVLLLRRWRSRPIWAAFWLFYVITLAPMLGLIQVGGQWAADRYSYLPSLGIALLWGGWTASVGISAVNGPRPVTARLCILFAVAQLLFYSAVTLRQIPVWRNTETLATRIIDTAPHLSGAPYMARATYLNEMGRSEEALDDILEAMKIALKRGLTRTYPELAFEQAVILKSLGRYSEALTIMDWGIQVSVDSPPPDAIELRSELARLASEKPQDRQR